MERPGAMTLKGNPFTLIGPELKLGDAAPDFTLTDNALKPVTLKDTGNQVRIVSVVPSLDTPVCDARPSDSTTNWPSFRALTSSRSAWTCRLRKSAGAARSTSAK